VAAQTNQLVNWYYALEGKQVGPITDADFQTLVQSGTVRADTLVWREGMANWLPYAQLAQPAAAPPPASGGIVCSECGRVFAPDDVIQLDNTWVCASCKPAALQKMREGVPLSGTIEYAGFWVRFVAKFIDGLILGIPMMIAVFSTINFNGPPQRPTASILMQLAFYGVGLIYNTFFIGKYGATPGKMAMKLRVMTASGEPVSYARAAGRYFAEILSGLICYIGYIMAGFDKQKRALHDHICNTRVVRRPS
jgi:uncharacterized RDD family membrane protein YckC